jgi:uncharacterized protein (TIGR03000 family)
MTRLRLIPLVCFALLAPAAAARAQAVGSPALAGWTTGSPVDHRPIVPVRDYSSSAYYSGKYGSLASPIFMTTLQTPGIYGAYDFGNGGITRTREPWFSAVYDDRETIPATSITTLPLRRPSTPAGAPTLAAGPPSVVPAVPGSATVPTYPGQLSPVATPPEETGTPMGLRTIPGRVPPASTEAPAAEETARVVVRVPDDARLEFEGVAMPETGRIRKFVSPPLVPGRRYHYDVLATWQEDGHTVTHERRINVYAGEKAEVDFLAPPEENRERDLRTRPILPPPSSAAPARTVPPRSAVLAPPRRTLPAAPAGTVPPAPRRPTPAAPGGKTPAVPPEGYLESPPGMTTAVGATCPPSLVHGRDD